MNSQELITHQTRIRATAERSRTCSGDSFPTKERTDGAPTAEDRVRSTRACYATTAAWRTAAGRRRGTFRVGIRAAIMAAGA